MDYYHKSSFDDLEGSRDIMMAASSPSADSDDSTVFPSSTATKVYGINAADNDFGSFVAASGLQFDPFGDVYAAEADFGDFVGQKQSHEPTAITTTSSLLSPLSASEALSSPMSGEVDPFADITGGFRAATGNTKEVKTRSNSGASATASSSTSAILDLVWGKTTQDTTTRILSKSSMLVGCTSAGTSKLTSSPKPSTIPLNSMEVMSLSFHSEPSDLLSFSPVEASAPIDPFFGIDNNTKKISEKILASENDEIIALTTTPLPLASSAPTSLRGSFALFQEEQKFSMNSLEMEKMVISPGGPCTTRSTRSLSSSSFVSAGTMEDLAQQFGKYASFQVLASATPSCLASSPLSAPPSLRSSFRVDGFTGYASSALEDTDEIDPFAEAGLAAPDEMPLFEALAAWQKSAEPVTTTGEDEIESRNEVMIGTKDETSDFIDDANTVKEQYDGPQIVDELNVGAEDTTLGDTSLVSNNSDATVSDDMLTKTQQNAIVTNLLTRSDVFSTYEGGDEAIALDYQDEGGECDEDSIVLDEKFDPLALEQPAIEIKLESTGRCTDIDLSYGVSDGSFALNSLPSLSPSDFTNALAETFDSSDNLKGSLEVETDTQENVVDFEDSDNFGDFENFEAPAGVSTWHSYSSSPPVQNSPVTKAGSHSFKTFAGTNTAVAEDAFADFDHNDDFGEFNEAGDCEQTATNNKNFANFQQSGSQTFGEDDGFGDFGPAVPPTSVVSPTPSISSAPLLSKSDWSSFFQEALAIEPFPTCLEIEPDDTNEDDEVNGEENISLEFVQDLHHSLRKEYVANAAGHQLAKSLSASDLSHDGDRVSLDRKTARPSKYLKYVLAEKIQEASRQNGIFPHGSQRHKLYVEHAVSDDADRMRVALNELQEALFHCSVNDAMMRIAKQAALSAKAKIAEQAAQQHASSRGGSLFSTTRQLLSRSGGSTGVPGFGSNGHEKGSHVSADTPTGASAQKLARLALTSSRDDSATSHLGISARDEIGSVGSDRTGHSSGSDSEIVKSAGDSRTKSQNLISSNGGLMRKFQDRFPFASSKHRPRFVSLRRERQSSEEVRKMELHLDAINGGLDEVKWKCAMFLYDMDEVAHVAPSQIQILSYPSKQLLTGKTDRSALMKLVKPHTIWTVDIGANHSDMLNDW
ncbi:hypothetical protein CCR75_004944 [Bremia lactucae]|uniref:Uncharacterized protein n=1 Tax=Bremia lactucae TaxID=4779 RepID=A0A976IBK8_BRELC|nr:hypothetical protein CCR75_004944 [Bremia lactucae]